ncbi:MAG: HAMP domain-containing histidine kinase [Leptolyngbya sp. SIOISBB]|nr:HAMP domain-containing histidine kinase [Leptolyngbya sp. SIOISBB]
MSLSRTQYWLTGGFSLVLIALTSTAWLARRGIFEQVRSWERAEADSYQYAYINELLLTIADAEVYQKIYLNSADENSLEQYHEHLEFLKTQLEDIAIFQVDLEDDSLDFEDFSPDSELLEEMKDGINRHISLLESELNESLSDSPNEPEIALLNQQLSESRRDLQLILQAIFDIDVEESGWAIADASLSTNNQLWLWTLSVLIGSITMLILYVWLFRDVQKQKAVHGELSQKKLALSERLKAQQTALEKANETLKSQHNQLSEIEQEKQLTDLKLNFFALASHELRTPLSAILVSAQLLDKTKTKWSEEKRSRNLKRIQSSAKTMTQLLSDILLLTRAEAGKLELNPQTINLQEFCVQLIEEVKFNSQAQQQIVFSCTGEQISAQLDEKLLRSLLMSLLTNAIKYSSPESEIQFRLHWEESHVQFQIQDQGIGISAADQQHLFESFHRGQNAKTISGAGLGLAVVRKCLELQKGDITVQSQLGLGTTVTIELPC